MAFVDSGDEGMGMGVGSASIPGVHQAARRRVEVGGNRVEWLELTLLNLKAESNALQRLRALEGVCFAGLLGLRSNSMLARALAKNSTWNAAVQAAPKGTKHAAPHVDVGRSLLKGAAAAAEATPAQAQLLNAFITTLETGGIDLTARKILACRVRECKGDPKNPPAAGMEMATLQLAFVPSCEGILDIILDLGKAMGCTVLVGSPPKNTIERELQVQIEKYSKELTSLKPGKAAAAGKGRGRGRALAN